MKSNLGPLARLVGTWEGDEGVDVSPGPEETRFRERMTFEPFGPVVNGPQVLYGLRYATTAWPIGEDDPFHEEVGYWLWDAAAGKVMRCFLVPRGITVLAVGDASAEATRFEMSAELGSETHGISSNPILAQRFRTVRYDLTVSIDSEGRLSYEEDTVLEAPEAEPFHHTDRNRLSLVSPQP